ncbi:MAG: hypothetical protein PHO10_08620 [Gemmiger sp.]|nr:hypothetical protein [Gemmiger sp.]
MTPAEKLRAYEAMQAAVQAQYDHAVAKMAELKAQGKEKTVTYRQLMTDKMTARTLLGYYKIYKLAGPV